MGNLERVPLIGRYVLTACTGGRPRDAVHQGSCATLPRLPRVYRVVKRRTELLEDIKRKARVGDMKYAVARADAVCTPTGADTTVSLGDVSWLHHCRQA